MVRLTEASFFHYAKCPRWIGRTLTQQQAQSAFERLLLEERLLPEVAQKILATRGTFETVEDEDADDAALRTLDFMRQGVQTIARGALVGGHWVGRPDIFERVEGKSDLGNYYYVAADIKRIHRAQDIGDGHKLQGALYAELLERAQGVKPQNGYVLSPEGKLMRYDLESFEVEYRLTLKKIEGLLSGEAPEHILSSGCKASPFFAMCVDETEACDDLSLLNRIYAEEIRELKRCGIETVMALASADLAALRAKVVDINEKRLQFLQWQAIALKERLHRVVEPVTFPSAPVELYFDIEADPLRDVDFLFGVLRVEHCADGTITETYHAFLAERPEDERRAWGEFAAFLDEHRGAPVYHYGWYEVNVCARLFERYGAPEGAVESWREHFYDLNAALRERIIFPFSFYSLKDLAHSIGFFWRSQDASGIQAVHWYHQWMKTGDRAWLERVTQYNEDDVRATRQVKEWAEREAGNKGAGV